MNRRWRGIGVDAHRLTRRFVSVAGRLSVGLLAIGGGADTLAAQPDIVRTIIVVPFTPRPSQPPGPLPPSCDVFLKPMRRAHWELQATQLAHEDTVRGQIQRVVDARATLVARPALERVTLREFADTGQALAEFDLDEPHNGLAAGRYCLVTRYSPHIAAPAGEFDRLRWQMYLYALDAPQRRAAAWVPFISRIDRRNDSKNHPRGINAPSPPVHFNFTVVGDLLHGASHDSVTRALHAMIAPNDFLAMAAWGTCAFGCCSGGVEALTPY